VIRYHKDVKMRGHDENPKEDRTMAQPAQTRTQTSISDAGKVRLGAGCCPLPAPKTVVKSIADTGRVRVGAGCRLPHPR